MQKSEAYFKGVNELLINNFDELEKLIIESNKYTKEEIALITKAYLRAAELHKGQKRKNGDPFIIHPVNVAEFLVRTGFDAETIIAALLHDTVEDTDYTLDDIEKEFGHTIRVLVDGVTNMKDADFTSREERVIETHKKILEGIIVDARIIAIKLADRLHNMATCDSMPRDKQIEKSLENMEFYIPVARAAGIYSVKDELQDYSTFYLEPSAYELLYDIRRVISRTYHKYYLEFKEELEYRFEKQGITGDFDFKVKNVGAIYNELHDGKKLNEIDDLIAIRVVLDEAKECYDALSCVNKISTAVPGSLNDYIKSPKYNGYRSINQNIMYKDKDIQVRIRDKKMHRTNYLGVVSDWNSNSQGVIRGMFQDLIALKEEGLTGREFIVQANAKFLHRRGDH